MQSFGSKQTGKVKIFWIRNERKKLLTNGHASKGHKYSKIKRTNFCYEESPAVCLVSFTLFWYKFYMPNRMFSGEKKNQKKIVRSIIKYWQKKSWIKTWMWLVSFCANDMGKKLVMMNNICFRTSGWMMKKIFFWN